MVNCQITLFLNDLVPLWMSYNFLRQADQKSVDEIEMTPYF